jgi:signal peptidase II
MREAKGKRPLMTGYPRTRIAVYLCLTIVTLSIDLLSKQMAFDRLGLFAGTGWLWDGWLKFQFFTSLNRGALWGLGQGFAPGFAALSVLALVGINYWLFVRGTALSLWLTCALGLVSGGTIGNLYDRLGLHGLRFPGDDHVALAVRDFLRFRFGDYEYPIFNLADAFLVTGAIMLMIHSLKADPQSLSPAESVMAQPASSGQQ